MIGFRRRTIASINLSAYPHPAGADNHPPKPKQAYTYTTLYQQ